MLRGVVRGAVYLDDGLVVEEGKVRKVFEPPERVLVAVADPQLSDVGFDTGLCLGGLVAGLLPVAQEGVLAFEKRHG